MLILIGLDTELTHYEAIDENNQWQSFSIVPEAKIVFWANKGQTKTLQSRIWA